MVGGRRAHRPSIAEPAAAAVGLGRAGWSIDTNLTVEVSDPTERDLPRRVTVVSVNGRDVTTQASREAVTAVLDDRNTFEDGGGRSYEFAGPSLPYRRVELVDRAPDDLDVAVGGRLARTAPGTWVRRWPWVRRMG
jgi:hypothetical protein